MPVLPNGQEDSDAANTGTRVESAPGVVLINTLLLNGQGAGTGMVIDSSGLVLTNYHVVEGSTTVSVTIGDTGQTYEATVVGHDASRDIALLQLENAEDLKTVKINTDGVSEGDEVSAIGNGMGQGYLSEVKGSVTALNQQITAQSEGSSSGSEELSGLIKTDADVVSGYSGGPLMNADGEVIGVTTAASMGVTSTQISGYAIPISDAMEIAEQIKNGQSSDTVVIGKNAALGVSISTPDADSQSSGQQADPSQSNSSGAIIREVFEGSGAEAAGLQAGETITALNGQELSASELSEAIKRYSVGDKVTLTVTGVDGASREVEVTLGESTVN
jgi:S1-C subfamily serine protease